MEEKKKAAYNLGVKVFVGLLVLTIIEYYVAFLPNSATPTLLIVAIIKAWLILHFFMHVSVLWSEEDH